MSCECITGTSYTTADGGCGCLPVDGHPVDGGIKAPQTIKLGNPANNVGAFDLSKFDLLGFVKANPLIVAGGAALLFWLLFMRGGRGRRF